MKDVLLKPRFRTSSLFARVLALALLAVLCLVPSLTSPTDNHRVDAAPIPDRCTSARGNACTAEEGLARKYTPVLYVTHHKNDCLRPGDTVGPLNVDAVLENGSVHLRRQRDDALLVVAPTAADLSHAPADAYLDYRGSPLNPRCRYVRDAVRFQGNNDRVAYTHIVRRADGKELALQYWFFFYFNDWTNKHEGDWEMVQLIFEAGSVEEALREEPDRIAFAQHSGVEVLGWNDPAVEQQQGRPVVYSSAGSHASYAQPGVYLGKGDQRAGFGCDDANGPFKLIDVRAQVVPHQPTGPDGSFAWLAYPGRWGEAAGGQFNGPTGPNIKWQWWDPFRWEQAHIAPPARRTLAPEAFGPDAVMFFCHAISAGSNLLVPVALDFPVLPAAMAGIVGLGLVSSLRFNRRFVSTAHRERGGVLAVFRRAFDAYRRRALPFLLLGLLSLPAGAFLASARLGLPDVTAAPSLIDLPAAAFVQQLTLRIALSEIQLGLACFFVAATVTAVLAAGRTGRSGPSALLVLWQHLPDLLLARLAAIVVVAGLSLTVVGIPFALRQAMRWAFLEQSILLEGRSAVEALREGRELLAGSWRRTTAVIALLGIVALVLAPALGMALLIWTDLSLVHVNFVAGVAYALLVPYIACVLAATYQDLRARRTVTATDASID